MLALALWCLAPGYVAAAGVTYVVTVDTTSLSSTSGYIDFQFNPANSSSLAASALVSSFLTDGGVGGQAFQFGDATGPLSGPLSTLSFDNGTPQNELTYYFSPGTSISFDVTVSGPALGGGAPAGATSSFLLTLFDSGGNPYSTGPGGAIATIVINEDGSTTGTGYPPNFDRGPTATVVLQGVPEPSTLLLGVIGFGALFGWHQVRRRAAA